MKHLCQLKVLRPKFNQGSFWGVRITKVNSADSRWIIIILHASELIVNSSTIQMRRGKREADLIPNSHDMLIPLKLVVWGTLGDSTSHGPQDQPCKTTYVLYSSGLTSTFWVTWVFKCHLIECWVHERIKKVTQYENIHHWNSVFSSRYVVCHHQWLDHLNMS